MADDEGIDDGSDQLGFSPSPTEGGRYGAMPHRLCTEPNGGAGGRKHARNVQQQIAKPARRRAGSERIQPVRSACGRAGSLHHQGALSYNEFKYAVWGRSADAEIVQVKETPYGTGVGNRPMVEVRYTWMDADVGERKDSFLRDSAKWKHAVGDRIAIEYLPGVMKSRAAGRPTYATVAIWFFFGLGGIALVLFAMLWRQGTRKAKVAAPS